ncbi:MAG TPA: type 1 glutamine amidotransferase [Chthoniobacteraceae bacterium]|jgi:GMP synthase (glutamine-hydrolysing)
MKHLLLIDAAECPPKDPAHARSEDEEWYRRHLDGLPGVTFRCVGASDPELESAAAASDALVVSGSPRDAWSDDPAVLRLIGLLHIAVPRGQPVLGVCFGHQLLARSFGGDVRRNPNGWEVGEEEITLTPAGRQSALFAGMPSAFRVIESHQDAVLSLPDDAVLLASNAHTPVQAFALGSKTFGVQFHPEMNGEILRDVWRERREKLRGALRFDLDSALDSANGAPEAAAVFRNFTALLS